MQGPQASISCSYQAPPLLYSQDTAFHWTGAWSGRLSHTVLVRLIFPWLLCHCVFYTLVFCYSWLSYSLVLSFCFHVSDANFCSCSTPASNPSSEHIPTRKIPFGMDTLTSSPSISNCDSPCVSLNTPARHFCSFCLFVFLLLVAVLSSWPVFYSYSTLPCLSFMRHCIALDWYLLFRYLFILCTQSCSEGKTQKTKKKMRGCGGTLSEAC